MNNYGALHTARGDINNIRNILLVGQQQNTRLMFILKEIVQNADDCASTRLGIGWSNGLSEAEHPLLRGPAILAVNDGRFSRKDAKSIRAIGLSSKENDSSAVGKFGLGLKTVFLICEAFFYLTGPQAESGVEPGSMLNLWWTENQDEDDVPVSTWDKLEFTRDDQKRIAAERERIGLADGFTLWLPLRQLEHCKRGGYIAPIVENYPGDETSQLLEEFRGDLEELADLLPLLKHLQNIEVYDGQHLYKIAVQQGSAQCLPVLSTEPTSESFPLKGTINLGSSKAQAYYGYQQLLNEPKLQALKERNDWPKNIPVVGPPEKQKAEPHCAVILNSRPSKTTHGKLLIRWAVFLPTAEAPDGSLSETLTLEAEDSNNEDYVLTLHGFFFLQSDRRRILNWSDKHEENSILQEWNRVLAEKGTLPFLLPTLADFAQNQSPIIIKSLTRILRRSELWKKYREYICSKGAWIYKINLHQPNQSSWQFISPARLPLTIPESTIESLSRIFPNLTQVLRDQNITLKEWPRLAKTDHLASWEVADLVDLLQGSQLSALETCANSNLVQVLNDFFNHTIPSWATETVDPKIIGALRNFLRSAFSVQTFQPAQNLDVLVAKLPPEQVLGIPTGLSERLKQRLFQLSTSCLVVPNALRIAKQPTRLSPSDAYLILNELAREVENSQSVRTFVNSVIDMVASRQSEDWQRICRLNLFEVAKVTNREPIREFHSITWLEQYKESGMLFKSTTSSAQANPLIQALANALQDPIYLTGSNRVIEAPECNVVATITLLKQRLPLQQSSELRRGLLQEIPVHIINISSNRACLRYLLHGDLNHFDDVRQPLFRSPNHTSNANSLWTRVLKHIVEPSEYWRFIDRAFLKILSPESCNTLGITNVDALGVESELRYIAGSRYSLNRLEWNEFSWEEREELICNLPNDLNRNLKLHEPLNLMPGSSLVEVNENTFLQGDGNNFRVNENLAGQLGIVLLRRSNRLEVAHRQAEISPVIDAVTLINRILQLNAPTEYWPVIMDAFSYIPNECESDTLKTSQWLPLKQQGQTRAPSEIIHLPEIDELLSVQIAVQQISIEYQYSYALSQKLLPALQQHPQFLVLCDRYFPSRSDALAKLGELLSGDDSYYVGSLGEEVNDEPSFQLWIDVFCNLPDVMPISSLLVKLHQSSIRDALTLFKLLKITLNTDRLIAVLNALSKASIESQNSNQHNSSLFNVFCLYLNQATQSSAWLEILSQIQLLSQAGAWQLASHLCHSAHNIDHRYLLHPALKNIVPQTNPTDQLLQEIEDSLSEQDRSNQISDDKLEENHEFVEHYFENWPYRTRRMIGILLRVLSSDKQQATRRLVDAYLPNATAYLECLSFSETASGSFITKTNKTFFTIQESRGKTISVKSLTGNPLSVTPIKEFTSLIVGKPERYGNNVKIFFQIVPLEDTENLSRLIKKTFQDVVEIIYGYRVSKWNDFWEKLDVSGIDIKIVRHKILHSGIISLRSQLKSFQREDPEIIKLLQKYSELENRRVELSLLRTNTFRVKELDDEIVKTRDEIGHLIINDSETQTIFLSSIRQRIRNASYDQFSIPFELFQNADDACLELRAMGNEEISREFVVGFDQENFWICHWGRPINQYYYQSRNYSDRGYRDDLLKMLLLNFSDKPEDMTGKFGLGFKSVFLLSERPKVVSSLLGFEVIGGIYPKELTKDEFDSTADFLEKNFDDGTVILLSKISTSETQPIVEHFKKNVPLLGAFSRWIKVFKVYDSCWSTWSWSEEPAEGVSNVYLGHSASGNASIKTLLLGRSENRCLIQLTQSGIVPLPSHYPTFWVTAPTRMVLNVGFAINAPFHLDVGRSQLDLNGGGKTANEACVREIGEEFGQALINLFQLDDTQLCRTLNLASGTTRLTFWSSLWEIFGEGLASQSPSDKGIDLLYQMFWSPNRGVARLYSQCNALPTGLSQNPDGFNCLTHLANIRWASSGILDTDEGVLAQVLRWPVLTEGEYRTTPGQIVSHRVAGVLKKLMKQLMERSIESLNLLKVLRWQFANGATPRSADIIGRLITKSFLEQLPASEQQEIKNFLRTVRFQARDEQWHIAQELLVESNSIDTEESRLAKFAPLSALLSEAYSSSSLELLYACRSNDISLVSMPFERRGRWILQANFDNRRYCIQYLIESEHRDEVIAWLHCNLHGSWLEELRSRRDSLLSEYEIVPYLFDALLYKLGLLDHSPWNEINPNDEDELDEDESDDDSTDPDLDTIPAPTAQEVLRNILRWWSVNREHLISEYEEQLYPNGDLILTQNNYSSSNSSATRRWLTLFMLGALHTMGRTSFEQHRTFLQRCENWGWIDVMANGEVNEVGWINLLDRYFTSPRVGDRLQYYQWVRYYPAFYAFSKWLDAYRDSLLATNDLNAYLGISQTQLRNPIDLVLNPQQNPALQGTGIGQGAPPVGSILGIGSTFIVRELVRSGILSNPGMRPYAYVPVRRVRAMLFAIGCSAVRGDSRRTAVENSTSIHDFLVEHLGEEDATYFGDYDLPFLMLQNEPRDVQEELLGRIPVPQEPVESEDDVSSWVNFSNQGDPGEWRTRWDGVRFRVR